MNYLLIGGGLSLVAALMHLGIVIGGPSWYRFFGAGEKMAAMAEVGSIKPMIVTLCIALVLFVLALYAFAGAGLISPLPLQNFILICITGVYLFRAIVGFILVLFPANKVTQENSIPFWLWSSSICLLFGLVHLKGFYDIQ